jgi:hypothetical protein
MVMMVSASGWEDWWACRGRGQEVPSGSRQQGHDGITGELVNTVRGVYLLLLFYNLDDQASRVIVMVVAFLGVRGLASFSPVRAGRSLGVTTPSTAIHDELKEAIECYHQSAFITVLQI